MFLGWVKGYNAGGFWLCKKFWNLISLEDGVVSAQDNKKYAVIKVDYSTTIKSETIIPLRH